MKVALILLVIGALVLRRMGVHTSHHHMGDHMGHGCHKSSTMMPFLKNVSSEARKQYTAILKSNETIAQQNEDIMNWAKAHGIKDQLDEYNENVVRMKQELKRNFTSMVSVLPKILAEFFNITENEDQTQAERKAALKELKNRIPKAFNLLRLTFAQLKPRQHCSHKGKSHGAHGMSEEMPSKMMSREEMKDMMTRMMPHMMSHMMSHMMEHEHMDGSHDSKDGHKKKESEEDFEQFEPFYGPQAKEDSDVSEDTKDA